MNYINTDYYYQELSNIANDVITEIEDNIWETPNKELVLNEGMPLNYSNNRKVVKLVIHNDGNDYDETYIVFEDGKEELLREQTTDDIITIAEFVNGTIN